jgi:hypothetical protein
VVGIWVKNVLGGQAWWLPATQEAEIQRTTVRGQPRQKSSENSISTNKPSIMVHTCDPSNLRRHR